MDKKRLQNKLSQRKHRAKQQQKLKELETKCEYLTKKLNDCLYNNKSNDELSIIYNTVISRMNNINNDVVELKKYLDSSVFSVLNKSSLNTLSTLSAPPVALPSNNLDSEDEFDDDDDDNVDELGITDQTTQLTDVQAISQDILYKNFTIDYSIPNAPSSSSFVSNPAYDSHVINKIGILFTTTINNTNQSNALSLIESPSIINMVCSYANEIFEKIPELKHYTFAYGGVKWLCGQILLCCLSNPKLESIHNILFNPYNETYSKLYTSLEANLTKWLISKDFNNSIDLILTNLNEYDNFYSILHQFFNPTTLQRFLLKQNGSKYPYWINFIIWPEFRDCLLFNLNDLDDDILKSQIFGELLTNVVLVINDENIDNGQPKLFQMKNVSKIINYTVEYLKYGNHTTGITDDTLQNGLSSINTGAVGGSTAASGMGKMNFKPTIPYLAKYGLFNPFYWKLAKSYGEKFKKVVPPSLVIWNIDDKIESNLLKLQFT